MPLLVCLGVACSSARVRTVSDSDYPGALRTPASLGLDLMWQQRVTARWGDGMERGFEAAVQKRGDTLTVIGLSPLGQAGFVLTQDTAGVRFENRTDMELPFSPRFVLLDVQRTFFPWLPINGAVSDGEHSAVVDGERVVEVRSGGKLRERRFTRCDGMPAGDIVVRYEWSETDVGRVAPRRAVLDNGWFGYRMTVETHAETVLSRGGS